MKEFHISEQIVYWVECINCGISTGVFDDEDKVAKAAEKFGFFTINTDEGMENYCRNCFDPAGQILPKDCLKGCFI